MKLRKLLQRTAAAAVVGAMALSISMPALAATWDLSNSANNPGGLDLSEADVIETYVDEETGKQYIAFYKNGNNPIGQNWYEETTETVITGSSARLERFEISSGASVTLDSAAFGEANASTQATVHASGGAQLTLTGDNTISGKSRGVSVSDGSLKLTGDGTLTIKGGSSAIEYYYGGSVTADGGAKLNLRDANSSKEDLGENIVGIANGYTGQVKYYTGDAETPYLVIPEVQAEGYGITVNGTPVTNVNKDDILPTESGSYSLKYIPNENGTGGKLVGTGSLPALDITVSKQAGTVDVELGNETAPANVYGNLAVVGAHDVTATGSGIPTITSGALIFCTGNVNLSNSGMGMAVSGTLTVKGAEDVTVTGNGTGPAISSGADITCTGNVNITCTTGMAVSGELKVTGAQDVTVSGKNFPTVSGNIDIACSKKVKLENEGCMAFSGEMLKITGATDVDITVTGDNTSPTISTDRGTDITCTGNVTITNSANIAVANGLKVNGAKNVTVTSKKYGPAVTGSLDIACSGKVELKSEGFMAFSGEMLKITGATDVDIESTGGSTSPAIFVSDRADINCTGNVKLSNDSGAVISGTLKVDGAKGVTVTGKALNQEVEAAADITCSGKVTLVTISDILSLNYTQSAGKAYTVKAGLSEETAEQLDKIGDTEIGAAGTTLTLEPVPTDYRYICITPEADPVIPGGDEDIPGASGDGSGIAGAVVAGTLIGGAAIWSGYEITTRVILSELLPAGAAIPKNQGELALLLWLTAGKPEPEQEAPYADDTAKAAQWCMEQGWLDSTDTGTWVPKYKTIEVWKKAFPKQ